MENLTEAEYNELISVQSEQEWDDACDRVKGARNGQYPKDWYAKMLRSGVAHQVLSKFTHQVR